MKKNQMLYNRNLWIGLGISLFCLWLSFHDVPFGELLHYIKGADSYWLMVGVVSIVLSLTARSQRWIVLLDYQGSFSDAFWAQCIGYLFTNIFPMRLGEPTRAIVMSKRSNLPFIQVSASVVIERLLDVLMLVLLMYLVLPWLEIPSAILHSGLVLGGVALSVFLFFIISFIYREISKQLLVRLSDRIRWISTDTIVCHWNELMEGIAPLVRWRIVLLSCVWSIVTWFFAVFMFWAIMRAFHHDSNFIEAGFAIATLSIAISIPSSPGFIGVYQLAGKQALVVPFGEKYDESLALAITCVSHLLNYIVLSVFGIFGLWWTSQSIWNLLKYSKSYKDDSKDD